jgi:hypothetical protein
LEITDDGGRDNDVTNKNTNADGQITATASFASAGQRNYYAMFGGDSSYGASLTTLSPLTWVSW